MNHNFKRGDMMQRWRTIVLLAATSAGCNPGRDAPVAPDAREPAATENAPSSDAPKVAYAAGPCGAQNPGEKDWDGSPPEVALGNRIWVITAPSKAAFASANTGPSIAALVDADKGSVVQLLDVPHDKLPAFMGFSLAGQVIYPGHPNPPPPVTPEILRLLAAQGQQAVFAIQKADKIAGACQ